MAIDTESKRRSAAGAKRLPWFRRFQPLPDGTIGQGDRQSLAFVYSGITAAAAQAYPGLDYIASGRLHYTTDHDARLHYTAEP